MKTRFSIASTQYKDILINNLWRAKHSLESRLGYNKYLLFFFRNEMERRLHRTNLATTAISYRCQAVFEIRISQKQRHARVGAGFATHSPFSFGSFSVFLLKPQPVNQPPFPSLSTSSSRPFRSFLRCSRARRFHPCTLATICLRPHRAASLCVIYPSALSGLEASEEN